MAISLSYDDALASQLDHAVPALDQHQLIASFYLTLASPLVRSRLTEWRAVAKQGHELGNHSIYHSCRGSLPNRQWVKEAQDLDHYSVEQIINELSLANSFLFAIDGQELRTFTPPCGDVLVGGKNFLSRVEQLFVGIKGYENTKAGFAVLWTPQNVTAQQLISRVKNEQKKGTKLLNIVFHGVGGDYLSVSDAAHQEFLTYLVEHKKSLWVDSYINIIQRHNNHSQLPENRP